MNRQRQGQLEAEDKQHQRQVPKPAYNGGDPMIDTPLNLLFNCPHRHLTRPFTPISKSGVAHSETYVVCLDCAKQFAYDFETMQIGKAIERTHDHCVVHANMPHPHRTKVKYALAGAGVPIAMLLGSKLVEHPIEAHKEVLSQKAGDAPEKARRYNERGRQNNAAH